MGMVNYEKVQKLIEAALGSEEYQGWVMEIAEKLNVIDADAREDLPGREELIAKEMVEWINGERRYLGTKDMMDIKNVTSLDYLKEKSVSPGYDDTNLIETEDINEFQNIGSEQVNELNVRDVTGKIARVKWIKEQLLEDKSKSLVSIQVGKQTANDYLSDLAGKEKDGDTEYMQALIEDVRKLSKANFTKGTTTQKLRTLIAKQELKNWSTEKICDKYHLDYTLGSIRKLISRLKLASV